MFVLKQKARIVEVKGPNDTLSVKQEVWLDYLVSCGAVAEVCHVEGRCEGTFMNLFHSDYCRLTASTFNSNPLGNMYRSGAE